MVFKDIFVTITSSWIACTFFFIWLGVNVISHSMKKNTAYWPCIIAVVWTGVAFADDNTVCTPTTSPPSHPRPPLTDRSVYYELALKDILSQTSLYGYFVFDADSQRSSRTIWAGGIESHQIVDFVAQTALKIEGGKCQKLPLSTVDPRISGIHEMTIEKHLNYQRNSVYMNKTNIRGIPVEHWSSCHQTAGGGHRQDDLFLATTQWLNPTQEAPPFLVREIQKIWDKQNKFTAHIVTDFVKVQPFQAGKHSKYFEVPEHVICVNVSEVKTWPEMPQSVSTSVRIIRANKVTESTLFYDRVNQLSRETTIEPLLEWDGTPNGEVTVKTTIRDFNSGVMYSIGGSDDPTSCTVLPFNHVEAPTEDSYLDDQETQSDDGFMHMTSVEHMFGIEGDFSYSGQYMVRGVKSDMYFRFVQNYNGIPGPTRLSFYFATDLKTENTFSSQTNTHQLLRREVSSSNAEQIEDFYNYDPEPMQLTNAFDVTPCFEDSEKIPFLLAFKVQELPPTFRGPLADAIKMKFVDVLKTPVRFHWDDVSIVDGAPSMRGVILGTTPDVEQFRKTAGKEVNMDSFADYEKKVEPVTVTSAQYENKIMTSELCARLCSSDRKYGDAAPIGLQNGELCYGFDHCDSSTRCTFYKSGGSASSKPDFLKDSSKCDHYQRDYRYSNEPSLNLAWNTLQTDVKDGKVKADIAVDDKTLTFEAVSLTDLRQDIDSLRDSDDALRNYVIYPSTMLSEGQDVKGRDLGGCATACTTSASFRCKAFMYCGATAQCMLTSQRPNFDYMQESKPCDVFSRTYLTDFIKLPEKTLLTSSDAVYEAMETEEDCAVLCQEHQDFHCESFEFCTSAGGTCLIGKKHIYTATTGDLQESPTCTHYSRNYLSDFVKVDDLVTTNGHVQTIKDISAEKCARECVINFGGNCVWFGFIVNPATCLIFGSVGGGPAPPTKNGNTEYYYRKYNDHENVRTSEPQVSSDSDSGYSGGAMAGAAFGTMVLGIVVGFLVMLVVAKLRRKPSSANVTMSFTPGQE